MGRRIPIGGLVRTVRRMARRIATRGLAAGQRPVRRNPELESARRRFEELVNTVEGIVWEADATTFAFTFVSRQAERLLGYPAADWLASPTFWVDHIHPGDRDWAPQYCADCTRARKPHEFEYRMVAADGRTVWLKDMVSVVEREGTVLLRGLMVDITDRKEADAALSLSEVRYRRLVEFAPEAIVMFDLATARFSEVNPNAERLFGLTREELLCMGPVELSAPVQPDGRRAADAARAYIAQAIAGELPVFEWIHRDAAGRDIPCEVRLLHLTSPQGPQIRGSITDISDRKRAETERQILERRLQETQKLESLGVLAGGIAHDFNNLLTGILGNASLARADVTPDSRAAECLTEVEKAGRRAGELCQQMLAYSGRGRFDVRALDLTELVEDAASLLRHSVGKTVALRFDLARSLPPVTAAPTQLHQVLMNLVINASDAIGTADGRIRVVTGVTHADHRFLASAQVSHAVTPGRYVLLEVSDSGCGMNEETLARIFDPFFTTKFTGRGLGLAAVLGIVRSHGGALKVSTSEGQGSTFRFLLPVAEGAAVPRTVARPNGTAGWRGKGRVLLVDDEEVIRATARRLLEAFGFEVEVAATGQEGLARLEARGGRYAATLLDLTMPGLTGDQTLQEIRARWPGLKVVVMSGFSADEMRARLSDGDANRRFIEKPFTADLLRSTLRDLIGDAAA